MAIPLFLTTADVFGMSASMPLNEAKPTSPMR
jgi:hypothetical protein